MWSWMSADGWDVFSLELHEKAVISTYVVDLYPLSLFTLLFSSCRILVSMALLCREVCGFDYELCEEPSPIWCDADSKYLLLMSSGCCIKRVGESPIALCLFQTPCDCMHLCHVSLSCLFPSAGKS